MLDIIGIDYALILGIYREADMTTCVFSGHREVLIPGIEMRLADEIERLLQTDSKFVFLSGGMGQFDEMGSAAVRAAKRHHSDIDIALVLVLPYPSSRLNTDKEYYGALFDGIIIPSISDAAHRKAAIRLRNRWMVEQSDIVLACVYRNFGGAWDTVNYARRLGKQIIDLAN